MKVAGSLLTGRIYDQDGGRFSPTFSTGRTGRIHRYYVRTDIQQGREGERRDGAVRRVGADALEGFVLAELRRLADRPALGAADVTDLLTRIELRSGDTHLVLDRDVLFQGDHPELALEDLRGGRTWTLGQAGVATGPVVDAVLADGLRRAHALAACEDTARHSPYERALRRLAFLSPDAQRQILEGRQPAGLTLQALLRAEPPLSWRAHRAWMEQVAG